MCPPRKHQRFISFAPVSRLDYQNSTSKSKQTDPRESLKSRIIQGKLFTAGAATSRVGDATSLAKRDNNRITLVRSCGNSTPWDDTYKRQCWMYRSNFKREILFLYLFRKYFIKIIFLMFLCLFTIFLLFSFLIFFDLLFDFSFFFVYDLIFFCVFYSFIFFKSFSHSFFPLLFFLCLRLFTCFNVFLNSSNTSQ